MSQFDSTTAGLSIGEVAARTGIAIETLRFYDRSGLLGDLPRTTGGHRVFDETSLGLLDVVVRLRRSGMPVEDVRASHLPRSTSRLPFAHGERGRNPPRRALCG